MSLAKNATDTLRFKDAIDSMKMDDAEMLALMATLRRMESLKSKGWKTRALREFGDFYRERRGLPPINCNQHDWRYGDGNVSA